MAKRTEIGRIKDIINSQFNKYAKQFTKEIAEEIEQAYEDTYKDFMDTWVKWKNSTANGVGTNLGSRFLLQASDAYWIQGNGGDIPVYRNDDIFNAGVHIDPENIKSDVYSKWGRRKGSSYDKGSVFEMMYYHGIMGYNRKIVAKSWYKTKKSQRKYYQRYHLSGEPNRWKILQKIYNANIIPPTAAKKPFKEMDQKVKKIKTKKHLDEKWNSIVGNLDKDIERLINKK